MDLISVGGKSEAVRWRFSRKRPFSRKPLFKEREQGRDMKNRKEVTIEAKIYN